MVIELILSCILTLLQACFSFINLPQFPDEVLITVDKFLNFIFDNAGVLSFFVNLSTVKVVIPVLLILLNFEHIYHFTIWILKKIPMLNIH